MKTSKQQYIDWPEVYHLCNYVADNVIKPDLIIGIAAGGVIPAAIIAKRLKVYNVEFIGIKSYTEEKLQETIQMYQAPQHPIPLDKKILIIDDLLDSGNSFKYIRNYLYNLSVSPFNVQFGAMHYKLKTEDQFKPHNFVYGTQCAGDVWLAYPWE